MARFSDTRMSKPTQDELWRSFCTLVHTLHSPEAVRRLFADMFNRSERLMIVRRLHIAALLESGYTYREIRQMIGAGIPTIARVHRWLEFGRGGYKRAVRAMRPKSPGRLASELAAYYNRH